MSDTKNAAKPLTALSLVAGRTYLSPSGRLCRLLPPCPVRQNVLHFVYLSKRGDRPIADSFALSVDNATSIARMREVLIRPMFSADGVMR